MASKGIVIKEDADKLGVFLNGIIFETEEVARKTLREAAALTKDAVIRHLPRSNNDKEGHVHMQDDVHASVRKSKDGGLYASVKGGKKTGTLWHLVNDGTYHSRATHFMDKAMAEVGPEIEAILDKEMGG